MAPPGLATTPLSWWTGGLEGNTTRSHPLLTSVVRTLPLHLPLLPAHQPAGSPKWATATRFRPSPLPLPSTSTSSSTGRLRSSCLAVAKLRKSPCGRSEGQPKQSQVFFLYFVCKYGYHSLQLLIFFANDWYSLQILDIVCKWLIFFANDLKSRASSSRAWFSYQLQSSWINLGKYSTCSTEIVFCWNITSEVFLYHFCQYSHSSNEFSRNLLAIYMERVKYVQEKFVLVLWVRRVTKSPSARQQCWPESFCKSGKFFATSSLLAEEFLDTLQYKISR